MVFKLISKQKIKNLFSSKSKTSNGMVSLQKKLIDKKLKDEIIRFKHVSAEGNNRHYDKVKGYFVFRDFNAYNYMFKKLLSNTKIINTGILETLRNYEQTHHKKKIKILDDGAGQGNFLSGLKNKWDLLRKEGKVRSILETTAVGLNKKLIIANNINKKKIGNISNLDLVEKYDFIFSVFGGFNYTITELKKEVLLKYVYSLNKNGVAIFGFSDMHLKNFKLTDHLKSEIKLGLKKRGFKSEFTITKDVGLQNMYLPPFYLTIERIK